MSSPDEHANRRRESLAAHPSARRILDLIAENAAKDLDAEWLRVAGEWSA